MNAYRNVFIVLSFVCCMALLIPDYQYFPTITFNGLFTKPFKDKLIGNLCLFG